MADPGTIHISVFATSFDGRYHPRFPFGDAQSQLSAIAAGVASASGSLKAQANIAAGAHGKISALGVLTAPGGGGGGTNSLTMVFPQTIPDMSIGTPVAFTVTAFGGTGIYPTWTDPGADLPPGLTFALGSDGNGLISGTPTTAGSFTPTLRVVDSGGTNFGIGTFSCTVT